MKFSARAAFSQPSGKPICWISNASWGYRSWNASRDRLEVSRKKPPSVTEFDLVEPG